MQDGVVKTMRLSKHKQHMHSMSMGSSSSAEAWDPTQLQSTAVSTSSAREALLEEEAKWEEDFELISRPMSAFASPPSEPVAVQC